MGAALSRRNNCRVMGLSTAEYSILRCRAATTAAALRNRCCNAYLYIRCDRLLLLSSIYIPTVGMRKIGMRFACVALLGILRRMSPEALSELIRTIAHNLVAAGNAGDLTDELIPPVDKLAVMRPKDRAHGDWASNIAMQLAKKAGMKPRDLAEPFAMALEQADGIAKVEVAGPGFINITLDSASAAAVVDAVLDADDVCDADAIADGAGKHLSQVNAYGRNAHLGGQTLNLEFVSANPTGPIHIGGTRWAAVGDAMARVLEANGANVVREYYFNDHGEQINRFAKSLVAAWAAANSLGDAGYCTETPCDGYKGGYINEIAARVAAEAEADGVSLSSLEHHDQGLNDEGQPLGEDDTEVREEFRKRAVPMMFDEIRKSMKDFRVNFDVWFHENSLYADGKVERAIAELKARGDIFEKDGATWFESTKHGDDKDRVIIKSNGEFAYFAADIAYYWDKRHRADNPADVAIYMLGADHHGYIGRMMAMCAAFGDKPGANMQILIGQLVNVMKDGRPVRMSKRAGNVVTIDDLVSVVGVDAARYSLARSDYNQNFDIDLALLASHTNDNPVYYVQYAYARSKNVDRNAAAAGISRSGADLALLDTEADGEVLASLAQFPSVLATAADDRQPHRVARYLEELAATYHKWYNVERVVPMSLTDPETRGDEEARKALEIAKSPEPARSAARLKLNDAVQQVIANGLDLLGVTAPEHM
jgi:arginyl-tRNA synthetase